MRRWWWPRCGALKMHGGVGRDDLSKENVEAVSQGCVNLERHLRNLKTFGVPPVVAINQFTADTDAELQAIQATADRYGARAIVCSHWANGGAGTEQLAQHVVDMIDREPLQFPTALSRRHAAVG